MRKAVIVISAYLATQMLSNITSLKIILFFGYSMDAGTLIYPLTFTIRDLVHKLLGKKVAQTVIIVSAVVNLCMAVLLWTVSIIPGDPSVGPQTAFAEVLSPVWRLVFASILAMVLSELVDTEVYHQWVCRVGMKHQWARVLVSNSISIPLDSVLFAWFAFGGVHSSAVVWGIVISNIGVKAISTFISMPLIYTVPEKRVEIVEHSTIIPTTA
ncbi:MAG: queuosine precursor transporter [Bacteroidetes bacterium]|nr:queuosine precursor transporter [Bacteroidota bacterium]